MELGEKVREARTERNMTLANLASATKLTKGFLSQLERGLSNPSLESLGRIASALDLPLTSLLAGHNSPPLRLPAFDRAPYVLRSVERSAIGTSLAPLIDGPTGVFAVARLVAGAVLEAATIVEQDFIQGFCLALSGEAVFVQGGIELALGEGDALAWD